LDTLRAFNARAKLLTTPGAKGYLKASVKLPTAPTELFFDIEADPMRDICYLHGFVVRKNDDIASETFIAFLPMTIRRRLNGMHLPRQLSSSGTPSQQ
jgi:predicted RecB family nuclease